MSAPEPCLTGDAARIAELERQLAEARETEHEIRVIVQAGDRPLAAEVSERIHNMFKLQREVFALEKERDSLRAQLAASEKDKAQRHRTMADAKTLLQLIECKCDSATYGNFVCPRCVTISNLDATLEAR